jgi:hypothetical protein
MHWRELGRTFLLCGVAGISLYLVALFALPPLALSVKLGVQITAIVLSGAFFAAISFGKVFYIRDFGLAFARRSR